MTYRVAQLKNGTRVRIHLLTGTYPPTTSFADDMHKLDLCEDALNADGPNPDGLAIVGTWGYVTEHALSTTGT